MGTSQIESDVIYFSASGILLNMHDETSRDLLSWLDGWIYLFGNINRTLLLPLSCSSLLILKLKENA